MPVESAVPAPAPAVEMAASPPSLQNPVALAAVAQLLQGTGGVEVKQHSLHSNTALSVKTGSLWKTDLIIQVTDWA